ALADPLSRLMASRGMPLGLSFNDQHKSDEVCEEDVGRQGPAEPSYRMEAIEELFSPSRLTPPQQQPAHGSAGSQD
ncbi:uncharacterized protein HaLaN_26954, partial [Haematococcus lacustris]